MGDFVRHRSIHELTIDELASRQIGLRSRSSGVQYARKTVWDEKMKARYKVLSLCSKKNYGTHGLSILTMPGLHWEFERLLLNAREGRWWVKKNPIKRTYICAIENDPAVYRAMFKAMPGLHSENSFLTVIKNVPMYAAHSVCNRIIKRFLNCDFFNMAPGYEHEFDAAWLDFTGPVTDERMQVIQEFYKRNVRKTLIVTALASRFDQATNIELFEAGSLENWFQKCLPGKVEHCFKYKDSVPMIQYAVSKNHS